MDISQGANQRELYASGSTESFIINTLSIYYDGLVDKDGNKTEIYLYAGNVFAGYTDDGVKTLDANLENTEKGTSLGKRVTFINLPINIEMPNITVDPVAQAKLVLDNISGSALEIIQSAVDAQQGVQVTYRQYDSNDLTAPLQDPPMTFWLEQPSINNFQMTAIITSRRKGNQPFPRITYDVDIFTGLIS